MTEEKGQVISIADYLKRKAKSEDISPKYEGIYPCFEGRVLSVSGQVLENGVTYSIIDYLPKGVEMPEVSTGDIFSAMLLKKTDRIDEANKNLEERVHRAIVPFNVHPEILNQAEVSAYFSNMGSNGDNVKAYVLEIVKGRSKASTGDMWSMMAEMNRTEHTGFRYILPLS